eukprot:916378-Amorphochlora_amoeboformis.AAC.2
MIQHEGAIPLKDEKPAWRQPSACLKDVISARRLDVGVRGATGWNQACTDSQVTHEVYRGHWKIINISAKVREHEDGKGRGKGGLTVGQSLRRGATGAQAARDTRGLPVKVPRGGQ